MTLTITERAILANQNKILALLDQENSEHYLNNIKIIEKGYSGLYEELFTNIDKEISQEICNETHAILNMYFVINNFIETLKAEEKLGLDLEKIEFEGFDRNRNDHFSFMNFIVEEKDLYPEYKGTNFNSHSELSLSKYRTMLPVYNEVIKDNRFSLNLDGLRQIIDAVW